MIQALTSVWGIVVLAGIALFLFGLGTARAGTLAVGIGVLAALVPVAGVVAGFRWIDRWVPGPARFLFLAFAWGACIATVTGPPVKIIAEAVGDELLGTGSGSVVAAPVVEEVAKALVVVFILWRRRGEFAGVGAGIVYAGFSASGFAFTENLYGIGRSLAGDGFGAGHSQRVIVPFFVRDVLALFAHPLFAVLTGIGIGIAARATTKALKIVAPVAGYLAAVCLHALWNSAALLGGSTSVIAYILFTLLLFLGGVYLVVRERKREQRIIAAALPRMAAARWIAPSEVELLASPRGRRAWRRQAERQSGRQVAKVVAVYQASAMELAFLDRRENRHAADEQRRQELLRTLKAAREEAVRLTDEVVRG